MESNDTTVTARVNREILVVLGWGRAILLQLAHPLIAAGVGDHSTFGGGSRQYVRRSRQTIRSMLSLTFGTAAQVLQTAERINAIHRRVHGHLREPTVRFPAGTPYTATDPELLRWVHTTLVDTQLETYELLVHPLTPEQRNTYCVEAAEVAPLLAIPDHFLPTTIAQVARRLQAGYDDRTIEVTDTARGLARQLLWPSPRLVASPLMALGRLVTIGLLPAGIREAYGFRWDERQQRRLQRAATLLRRTRATLPPRVCVWPASRPGRQAVSCPAAAGTRAPR